MNQVRILVQILISIPPHPLPTFGCVLHSQVLILAQRLGLEGVWGDR